MNKEVERERERVEAGEGSNRMKKSGVEEERVVGEGAANKGPGQKPSGVHHLPGLAFPVGPTLT